jgi:release factor glutamine methyltransferase
MMESTIVLSEIQSKFRSGLLAYYPDDEIRNIFFLASEHLLNYSKIDILLKGYEPISAETAEKFDQLLIRLRNWEPIQYIIGYTEFYKLIFRVDNRVLIPRPETEELVQWMIRDEGGSSSDVLDIGTGSGCIAVSLAVNMPEANVSACDVSAAALDIARVNAQLNRARVNFFAFDMLNDDSALPGKYRLIVSNPPYVRELEKPFMRNNVLDYEPGIALFVPDNDALVYYRSIALLGRKHLKDGGALYLEINENFSHEIVKLLKSTGFYGVEIRRDLSGKPRMVKARK